MTKFVGLCSNCITTGACSNNRECALEKELEIRAAGRPSITRTMIEIAYALSRRSTCARRQVGCVLVNDLNHILSTGYNGVALGETHCIDHPCLGASYESGHALDACEAIHAEANALLQCRDVQQIDVMYATTAPCMHCVKLLMNTPCRRIVFVEPYPHASSETLWASHSREWHQVDKAWASELRPMVSAKSSIV